jgi:hypothetical protein
MDNVEKLALLLLLFLFNCYFLFKKIIHLSFELTNYFLVPLALLRMKNYCFC